MHQICKYCAEKFIGKNSLFCSTMCYNKYTQDSKKRSKKIAHPTYDIRQLCTDILNIEPKINSVGIWYHHELIHEYGERLTTLLNEETEKSVTSEALRWLSIKSLGKILGAPEFSLVKYGKTYRIVLSLTSDDLIIVNADTDLDILSLIHKIQKIINDVLPFLKNSR